VQYRIGLVSAIVVTIVACKSDTQSNRGADTAGGAQKDTAAASAPVGGSVSWAMTVQGIGPLRTGMSIDEATRALHGDFKADTAIGCHEVPLPGAPGKVLATIVDGRIERFDTKDTAIRTELGARVGDTEARIESLYVGRVSVQPHKYLEKGHYLVVTPAAPSDSNKRLIFETDGARVFEYRAGSLPTVSFVEHCG